MNWINRSYKKKEFLSEKELDELLSVKPPLKYKIYLSTLIIGFITLILIVTTSILFFLEKYASTKPEAILYSHNEIGLVVIFLSAFFLSIGLISIPFSLLSHISPKTRILLLKQSIKNSRAMGVNKFPKPNLKKELKLTLLYIFIVAIITGPFVFLSLNSYTYATEDGIYHNPFFSLEETHKNFDEIEKIEKGIWMNNKGDGTNHNYILIFKDGSKTNLGEAKPQKLLKLDTFLKSMDIESEIDIDPEAIRHMESKASKEYSDALKNILDIPTR